MANKESRINAIIYSSKRTIISLYYNVIILVSESRKQILNLSYNRNFLYEPQTLNTLLLYAYIVDYILISIFMRNDLDRLIVLSAKQRFKKIIKYKESDCYSISLEDYDLAIKSSKRNLS